jgi:hypothetical protein
MSARHVSKYRQTRRPRKLVSDNMTQMALRSSMRLCEPDRATAYRLLAAFLILKSSIRLPERNCATSQRGCLPRPAQVSNG